MLLSYIVGIQFARRARRCSESSVTFSLNILYAQRRAFEAAYIELVENSWRGIDTWRRARHNFITVLCSKIFNFTIKVLHQKPITHNQVSIHLFIKATCFNGCFLPASACMRG